MKLYLDTCSLQRPLDNKSELRILLESEAVLGLLTLCESGAAELVSSEVLIAQVLPGHVAAIVEEMGALTAEEQETLGRLCRKPGKRES